MMMRQTPWNHPEQYHAPERTRDYAIKSKHLVVPVTDQYSLSDFYNDPWSAHILYGQTPKESDDVSNASAHGKLWLGVNTNTYNLSYLSGLQAIQHLCIAMPRLRCPRLRRRSTYALCSATATISR
jgi:hypothetical protein